MLRSAPTCIKDCVCRRTKLQTQLSTAQQRLAKMEQAPSSGVQEGKLRDRIAKLSSMLPGLVCGDFETACGRLVRPELVLVLLHLLGRPAGVSERRPAAFRACSVCVSC